MQNARPAPGQHDAADLIPFAVDRVERLLQSAEHVGRDGVQDFLVIQLERCDIRIDVERAVFELHRFLYLFCVAVV